MIVHRSIRAWLLLALLASCSTDNSPPEKSTRVLFFGNSVTYVGNLPAVLSALCSASGTQCFAGMIAQGGATISRMLLSLKCPKNSVIGCSVFQPPKKQLQRTVLTGSRRGARASFQYACAPRFIPPR